MASPGFRCGVHSTVASNGDDLFSYCPLLLQLKPAKLKPPRTLPTLSFRPRAVHLTNYPLPNLSPQNCPVIALRVHLHARTPWLTCDQDIERSSAALPNIFYILIRYVAAF